MIPLSMKKVFAVLALLGVTLTHAAQADSPSVNFGSSGFTLSFNDFNTFTQTAISSEVTGTDLGSSVFGDLPSTLNIAGTDALTLQLTAQFAGTATSNFQITFIDTNGNQKFYKGNLLSFANALTTASLSFDQYPTSNVGAFNNSVVTVGFVTAGTGGTVDMTLKSLAFLAVPEPGTYALFGVGLALLLSPAFRRKLSLRA
jgi:PEP-CTERM motif